MELGLSDSICVGKADLLWRSKVFPGLANKPVSIWRVQRLNFKNPHTNDLSTIKCHGAESASLSHREHEQHGIALVRAGMEARFKRSKTRFVD